MGDGASSKKQQIDLHPGRQEAHAFLSPSSLVQDYQQLLCNLQLPHAVFRQQLASLSSGEGWTWGDPGWTAPAWPGQGWCCWGMQGMLAHPTWASAAIPDQGA